MIPRRDRDKRFYGRTDFSDAFQRYLSDRPEKSVTSVTSDTDILSGTKKAIEIKAVTLDDACDAISEGDESNRHGDAANDTTPIKTWGENMSAVEVVQALMAEGVEFTTDGQRITWRNDDGWMKPEVVAILKSGEAEVILYLINRDRRGKPCPRNGSQGFGRVSLK